MIEKGLATIRKKVKKLKKDIKEGKKNNEIDFYTHGVAVITLDEVLDIIDEETRNVTK